MKEYFLNIQEERGLKTPNSKAAHSLPLPNTPLCARPDAPDADVVSIVVPTGSASWGPHLVSRSYDGYANRCIDKFRPSMLEGDEKKITRLEEKR
jgi:hypothetical protein